ncbi:class D sortase [Anoxybacillus flavithermus]|uniref:Class D sortase n=1 Tax=Anoxybacillus flavithermus TaxID=33934 RepID=A0A2G5RNT3_9BACL|nr:MULTISPECIES: class D sortase [Anoxybacillus]KFZ41695.1 sortase [Anoxybacillus sp. KU2-6(11)]PIC04332.1 class D sortase [Anoxybacillus flavithermus]
MRAVAIVLFLFSASFIWANVFGWHKAYEAVQRSDKPTAQQGDAIGTLFMPKLNIAMPIYEGLQQLNKGVAYDERSDLPGEGNHTILAGHRDTVFRKLVDIQLGDELVIRMNDQTWTYVVQHIRIVKPDDKTVFVPKAHPTLTLITCYPFRWIGDAPNRYVIIAKQKRG